MSTTIKSSAQVKLMLAGGQKLAKILDLLILLCQPGTNLLEIEKKAIQLIKKTGGVPAFSRVPNYHWATCLNINSGIVHGVPRNYQLKSGDIINIDIGLFYKGFNTDMSSTLRVKTQNSKLKTQNYEDRAKDTSEVEEKDKFLATGKKALKEAIKQAKPGNRVGHISQKIQEIIEKAGYNCSRQLTGHGVGHLLHEEPSIPCFLAKPIMKTPLLKPGMTLAIEVIYMMGKPDLVVDSKDRWTIKTKDGKIAAVFEQTIALTSDGSLILTELPSG